MALMKVLTHSHIVAQGLEQEQVQHYVLIHKEWNKLTYMSSCENTLDEDGEKHSDTMKRQSVKPQTIY